MRVFYVNTTYSKILFLLLTVLLSQETGPPKPRFRKREKLMFYGKKMLRKVRSFARHTIHDVSATSRSKKKKQLVLKLAKKQVC